MPFGIKLNDFIAEKYPGTDSSYSSFASEVTVVDDETFDYRIYMNNILNYQGYRFFQASFDPDEQGTILSVNHDFWGTLFTYIGYILLYFGLVVILFARFTRFDSLKKQLEIARNKKTKLVTSLELDAFLVASSVARQIENRISYKRAIKMAIAASIRMNAEGIKIQISGRLNGAEMARSEHYKEGRIPLSTFRADIDYAMVEAHTTYGRIGIKVWIMKGEVYGKRDLNPLVGLSKKQGKNNRRKRN